MHSCLWTPEIQYLIFRALDGESSTLYALALTCSTFKDVALLCLWENLESLYPVVHNLPDDLLDRYFHPLHNELELTFMRDLEPEDWTIFHNYSDRVQTLNLSKEVGVDGDIFEALSLYRPAQTLFPRLQSLFITLPTENDILRKHLPIFLSPTIKTFAIHLHFTHDSHPPSISSLSRLCPDLTNLSVEWGSPYPGDHIEAVHYSSYIKALSRSLGDLKALRYINIRPLPLPPAIFGNLSNLAFLKELRFSSNHRFWDPEDKVPYSSPYQLSNLTVLEITATNWRDFSIILASANASPLRKVSIQINDAYDPDPPGPERRQRAISDVLHLLAQMPTLERIQIYDLSDVDLFDESQTYIGEASEEDSKVEICEMITPAAYLLGNEWLQTVSSWRHLTTLRVYSSTHHRATKMTLDGLLPIITHCYNLHTLSISVLCLGFDIQMEGMRVASIKDVTFINSPIMSPRSIILHCLTKMFPEAESVSGSYLPDMVDWTGINHVFAHRGRGALA